MKPILFFDGVCVMCNSLIGFILRHDTKQKIFFAPLQGKTAHEKIPDIATKELKTVVLVDDSGVHTESDAILRTLLTLGGLFSLLKILVIIPKFIRDRVYRFVAKNRYRWFGTTESCSLLSPQERARILE